MPISTGKSYVVYFQKKAPIVVLLDDLFIICDTLVTMTAVIVGNTTNRTFLWEQVSGPSITWLTPQNQLSVQWSPLSLVRQDRLFRFYVDKGDPLNEQVFEMYVFATPTDKLQSSAPRRVVVNLGFWHDVAGNSREQIDGVAPLSQLMYTSTIGAGVGPSEPTSFGGYTPIPASLRLLPAASISSAVDVPVTPGGGQSSDYVVLWLTPLAASDQSESATQFGREASAKVRDYLLQENSGAGWVDVGTFTQPTSYPATTGNSYRVITRWENDFAGVTFQPTETASPGVYAEPDPKKFGTYGVSNFQVSGTIFDPVIPDYNVIERTLRVVDWNKDTALDDDQLASDGPTRDASLRSIVGPYTPPATSGDFFDFNSAGRTSLTLYNVIIRELRVVDWTKDTALDDDQYKANGQRLGFPLDFITDYLLVGGGTIGG